MASEGLLLSRLAESATALGSLLNGASNIPLSEYIDVGDAQALALSMSFDVVDITTDDLERVLLLRDGLYEMFHEARDKGDGGEHSIEQLINALSRVYVDLEALLKSRAGGVAQAQKALEEMQDTARADVVAVSKINARVEAQATEIISQINVTNRNITVNLINISDINLVQNLKINVKRLSASVFAIKMNFKQGVIFEGVIRFLNDGVDRIISDIKKLAAALADGFQTAKGLIETIKPLIEKGTRFVRLIASFIESVFDDGEEASEDYQFEVRSAHRTKAVLSAALLGDGRVQLGGKDGTLMVLHQSGQLLRDARTLPSDVRCLAPIGGGGDALAIGTADGLLVRMQPGADANLRAAYSEKINSVAVTSWGSSRVAIVTGASDGALRRWTLAGGLSQVREGMEKRDNVGRIGRTIVSVVERDAQNIVVATGDRLFILNEFFSIQSEIPIDRPIGAVCRFSPDTLVVVGEGLIAEVNLTRGNYSRMLTVSADAKYVAAVKLTERVIVAGMEDGTIRAIDMPSGAELGELKLDMVLRGLVVRGDVLVAYGGPWRNESRSVVVVQWRKGQSVPPELPS